MRLSATIIALDEADRIVPCLDSLRWADEIVVVVDDRTRDGTEAIARRYTGQVFRRGFAGYADQRQWADDQTTGEWILSLDCDEVVPRALAEEIRAALARPEFVAFRIPHLDYMFGKWIRHGGWHPQYHVRLYRKGVARWGRSIHERVSVEGRAGTLANPILHYAHARVSDWVDKMARYTTVEAEEMHRAGTRMGVARILLEPPLYAGYKLMVQQGWRDGLHGLALALLLGCYRLVRDLKVWDLHQAARGPREPGDCPP